MKKKQSSGIEQLTKKTRKYSLPIIISLVVLEVLTIGLLVNNGRTTYKLHQKINEQQTEAVSQQREIKQLSETKAVRNYKDVKKATDKGLNGAVNALYTWDGYSYPHRYPKAEKYMTRKVLKSVSLDGKLPTKHDIKSAAKDYRSIHANSKVTEIQNGIQDINGNNVSGFVWITTRYTAFNKDTTSTQQVKYTYNVATHKFTYFNPEPFSGIMNGD